MERLRLLFFSVPLWDHVRAGANTGAGLTSGINISAAEVAIFRAFNMLTIIILTRASIISYSSVSVVTTIASMAGYRLKVNYCKEFLKIYCIHASVWENTTTSATRNAIKGFR